MGRVTSSTSWEEESQESDYLVRCGINEIHLLHQRAPNQDKNLKRKTLQK